MNSWAPASRAARSIGLGRRVGVGEGDVGGDRVAEQERVLEHDADRPAQVAEAQVADVDAVERDRAGVDVVEAGEQPGDGGLARPGRARPARPTRPARRRGRSRRAPASAPAVAEAHAARSATSPPRRAGERAAGWAAGRRPRARWPAPRRPARPRPPPAGPGRRSCRASAAARSADDVDVEGDERAEAEAAVEHLVAAVAEHGDEPEVGQQLEGRAGTGARTWPAAIDAS